MKNISKKQIEAQAQKQIYQTIKERGGVIKKTIVLGKIKENGKNYTCSVSLELRAKEYPQIEFSASGEAVRTQTDWLFFGQCLDTIAHYFATNADFRAVYNWHKKYHLNTMHAGTPKQEAFLQKHFGGVNADKYDEQCVALRRAKLYDDKGYRFGTGWLYEAIPSKELKSILNFCKD
jgi:hypothetical protein